MSSAHETRPLVSAANNAGKLLAVGEGSHYATGLLQLLIDMPLWLHSPPSWTLKLSNGKEVGLQRMTPGNSARTFRIIAYLVAELQ